MRSFFFKDVMFKMKFLGAVIFIFVPILEQNLSCIPLTENVILYKCDNHEIIRIFNIYS